MKNYSEEIEKLESINKELDKNSTNYKMYCFDKHDSITYKRIMAFSLIAGSICLEGASIMNSIFNPTYTADSLYVMGFSTAGIVISSFFIASILSDKKKMAKMDKEYTEKKQELEELKEEVKEKIKAMENEDRIVLDKSMSYSDKEILENIKKEIEFLSKNNEEKENNKVKKI